MPNKFSPNPRSPWYSPMPPKRKHRRKLTPERKEQLRERIRQTKPWLRSTGPRTFLGKKIASQNAIKHGIYCRFDGKSLWAAEPNVVRPAEGIAGLDSLAFETGIS